MNFKKIRKQINEMQGVNGQTGPVLKMRYTPQKVNINKGLTSFSTVEKSDLYNDITRNHTGREWSITKNTNSLALRLPHPKGRESDRKDWLDLLKDAIPGKSANLIRGGGLTQSEVDELKRDYEKAVKAFGGTQVVSQDHEIYVSHKKPGKLKVEKGLLAMLKALDEFGMRNHVSLSSRDGVLTRIQDAGQYNYNESVQEDYNGNIDDFEYDVELALDGMGPILKSIKKKGKKYEVRLAKRPGKNYKKAMDEIAYVSGAKLVSVKNAPPLVIGLFESVNETRPGEYIGTSGVKLSKYKAKGKFKPFSPLKKKRLLRLYKDVADGKPGAISKVMDMIKDDTDLEEKGPGLWANIHKRRKSGKRMRKKGEKGAPTAAAMRSAKGESVNEDKFQLVNMSRNTARHADKLAKRVGLDTDFEGGVLGINLTVHGTKKKIEKWLRSLPLDNVDEGRLTRDDGGAYDGLRIAKYLAHQDGQTWGRMPYGRLQSYIDKGMDMLKRDKSKARDILSKPTPR
tara:strand:- start:27074 stop:28609 length:1536 start_codon:yes stop_codon:yes gene_type:complete